MSELCSNKFLTFTVSSTESALKRSWMGFRKTGRPSKKVMSGDLRSEESSGNSSHSASRSKTVRCTELGERLRDKGVTKDA